MDTTEIMRYWIESRFPPSAVAIDEAPRGPAGVEQSPVTHGWQSPRGWPHSSGSSACASTDQVVGDHAAPRSSGGARDGSPTGSAPPPAVTITPEVPKKLSRDVMNKLRTTAAEFKRRRGAYDGDKILFTSGPLNVNNEAQEYSVFLDDERRPSFKYVAQECV
ncbi:unnamed protein product [Sphagnum jensenii]